MKKCSVYEYTDYRKLLGDLYDYNKKTNPLFSFRYFSKKARFKSPNFLKLLINGSRNLTEESIIKVAAGFNLNKDESTFFKNLVLMNQSSSVKERKSYYEKMTKTRGYEKYNSFTKNLLQYFSEWYHPAVREMLTVNNLNPKQISEKLYPEVPVNKIKDSINLMNKLGFIKKDKNDKWRQSFPELPKDNEVLSLITLYYHIMMSEHATRTMEFIDPEYRDLSAVTFSIEKKSIEQLKNLIASFKKSIMKFADDNRNADEVFQVNFQLLPLTKIEK